MSSVGTSLDRSPLKHAMLRALIMSEITSALRG